MACKSLTATPCRCTLPTELRILVPETLRGCSVPPVVELLDEELLELEELLDDDELLLDEDELLDELELLDEDELDELELDDELLELDEPEALIEPVEAVRVTL